MTQVVKNPVVVVDSQGFVSVSGVRVGRLTSDRQAIQIVDRDKGRCEARGSRFVEIPISELGKLAETN